MSDLTAKERRALEAPFHLYKFRSIPDAADEQGRERLEALLLHNRLWLAAPSTFNDPFDGRSAYELTLRGAELRKELEQLLRRQGMKSAEAKRRVRSDVVANPEWFRQQREQHLNLIRNHLGVCALSANPRSPLLWAHYAQDHKGICVQLRLWVDPEALVAHQVEYRNDYPVMLDFGRAATGRDAMLPFLRKSTDWAYEEEWRLVEPERPNTHRSFNARAMTGVIFGLRTTEADKAYVRDLMGERQRRYGVKPTLYQSVAADRAYRVAIRKVPE